MRDWIVAYCMEKPGVTKEFKPAWNATLCRVGGKIFLMLGEYKNGRALMTVKLEPALSEILRCQYPGDIIPGYYTDKTHWSSLFLGTDVPDDTARMMLDNAYETTLRTLSKKKQAEIGGTA